MLRNNTAIQAIDELLKALSKLSLWGKHTTKSTRMFEEHAHRTE